MKNAISSDENSFFNKNGLVCNNDFYLLYEDGTKVKAEDEIIIEYSYGKEVIL